jgi:hypothetical protein
VPPPSVIVTEREVSMRAARWIVVAGAVAALGARAPREASADEERIKQEVKGVVAGLPHVGLSKNPVQGNLQGEYWVEGKTALVPYPVADKEPPWMTMKVNWKVSPSLRAPMPIGEVDKVMQYVPKDATAGALGQNTWMKSSGGAGTQDPNMSGDPYTGYAEGTGYTECGSVQVAVGVGIHSHGSHGARVRPEVIAACKKAAEEYLRSIFGQFLAVLRYGCAGSGPVEPPQETIVAEPECETVRLVRGKLPSTPCGIYVRNWPAARGVTTCLPELVDAWGLLPNGIVVTFRNEFFHVGSVVPAGRRSGEYYLSMWWYARCQAVPGVHTVEIHVQQSDGPVQTIGGCPASSNRATVRMRIEVLEETSPNCNLPPTGGTGATASGGGGGMSGGGSGGGRTTTGPAGPFAGTWKTDFGDLVLSDAGDGNVRGTLGTSGAVVTGKVKGDQFVGEFADGSGDGLIHLTSPDGESISGEWKRKRGPDAGKSGHIGGRFDPTGSGSGPGAGPGGLPGTDPGSGTPGGGQPGGPGTSSLPPLRPVPAALTGLTLQAPELRLNPGQEVVVPVWLLNGTDVVNMNWELSFDPSVVSGSTAAGSVQKGNLLTEAFEANPAQAGRVRMGFAQKKGINGTGTVSVHRLKAVGPVGTRTPLTLAVTTITDSRPQPLRVALLHGFVEVVAPGSGTPGSTGGGPEVTMQDAYNALRMSVGLAPENLNVDMDRDGKVTSLDAWLIMTRVFLTMKGGR